MTQQKIAIKTSAIASSRPLEILENPGKNRPLKIVLKSENEKQSVFKRLRMLKGNESFRGISITEDYTEAERNVLRLWNEKAKKKNNTDEDPDYCWRVRGSPKNGTLRLKKLPRGTNSQQ